MNDIIELIDRIKQEVGAAKSLEENVAALRVDLEEESGKLTAAKSNLALLTAELAARTTLGEASAKDEAPAAVPAARRSRVRKADVPPASALDSTEGVREADASNEDADADTKAPAVVAEVDGPNAVPDVAAHEAEKAAAEPIEPDAADATASIEVEAPSFTTETAAFPVAGEQMIAESIASGETTVDQPVRASSDDVSLFEDGGVELPTYDQTPNDTSMDAVEAPVTEVQSGEAPTEEPAEANPPKPTSFRRPSFLQQKG